MDANRSDVHVDDLVRVLTGPFKDVVCRVVEVQENGGVIVDISSVDTDVELEPGAFVRTE